MDKVKRGILYVGSLAEDVILAWPMVLLIWLFWGTGLRWVRGVLRCHMKPGSWPLGGKVDERGYLAKTRSPKWAKGFRSWLWPRGWYIHNRAAALAGEERPQFWGGTSVGHAQFYGRDPGPPPPAPPSALVVHEDHHTLQAEAANLAAFVVALQEVTVLLALGHPWAALWCGLGVWTLGGNVLVSAAGWTVAWLRSDPRGFYAGSPHEIGARGVGEYWQSHEREP